MTASRVCSECGDPLTGKGPHAKTCGPKCRSTRSRRLKRQKKEAGEKGHLPAHQKALADAVEHRRDDVVHKIVEEEVRPVVRESITEDTLKAIRNMVGLTPVAIRAIEDDLVSDDATIRQRAYTLILKYTVGHQALVRPEESDPGQSIQVNFALPRPESVDESGRTAGNSTVVGRESGTATSDDEPEGNLGVEPAVVEAEAVEVKTCDICGTEQPVDNFAANSTRCLDCYAKQRARADAFLRDHAE